MTSLLPSLGIPWWKPFRKGIEAEREAWAAAIERAKAAPVSAIRVHDHRHESPIKRKRTKTKGGLTVMRGVSGVTGVVLHQTAVVFGYTPRDLRRANASTLERREELAAVYRVARDVPVHAVAMMSGDVVLGMPLETYANHAGQLNASTLGLEIEGLYPGLIGGKVWGRRPETPLTDLTIECARHALSVLCAKGRKEGMPLRDLYAHRQSSKSRRSDPGEGLWRAVAPWAEHELGLRTKPAAVFGWRLKRGRPIPTAWDDAGAGRY